MSALLDVMCQELDCFKCPMNLHKVVEVDMEANHEKGKCRRLEECFRVLC